MKAKNFKLFIGYLGNGATVCNSAVYENGDYKTIAHISPAGHIKLYVSADYIPAADMETIKATAARHERETRARLDRETATTYGYMRTLEEIANYTSYTTQSAFFEALKECATQEARRELVKKTYLENF